MTRAVIVNGDDFGQSRGINRGIVQAHERGVLSSASLMVRGRAAAEAAAYARAAPRLSVGLHVDLCEYAFQNGNWVLLYERVPGGDAAAVEEETLAQLDLFRALVGRNPTHLDSHQHVHKDEPSRSLLMRLARELSIPLRHFAPHIKYVGGFYGQTETGVSLPEAVSTASFIELVRGLGNGVAELACHPGYADDLITMYQRERELELAALCSDEARAALEEEDIALITFSDVAA